MGFLERYGFEPYGEDEHIEYEYYERQFFSRNEYFDYLLPVPIVKFKNLQDRQSIHNNIYLQHELPERYNAFCLLHHISKERLENFLDFNIEYLNDFQIQQEIMNNLNLFPEEVIKEAIMKNKETFCKNNSRYTLSIFDTILLMVNT